MTDDSWNEYRRIILSELERIDGSCTLKADKCRAELQALERSINTIHTDVEMLKLKAGVWGFLAGFVPASIVALYTLTQ